MKPELIAHRDFFDTYHEAILIASAAHEFIYANACFVALTCIKPDELEGVSAPAFFAKAAFDQAIAGSSYRTLLLDKPGGKLLKLRVTESPVKLADQTTGTCYTLTPLTDSEGVTDGAKKFYELADASPAMIFLQGRDGQAYYFNKAWLEFTGKPLIDLVNTKWQSYIHPGDFKVLAEINAHIAARRSYDCEYRLKKHGEGYRSMYVIGTPVTSADGVFEGYMNSCLDITEVKGAQNNIDQLTHELHQVNEELEQFTYVTSHDLQEPLRMITGYVQLIQKNIEKGNLGAIHEFMEFVLSGTARMQALIADLLQLSRLSRKGAPFTAVNINEVMAVVTAHLAKKIQISNAEIKYNNLPTVTGDTHQLVTLFENILDNALKFTALNKQPSITIKAVEKDGKYIFEVKDNGIGIDNKFHKRIFAIFQRLHTRGEYEGTGIGLAVSKKIVERHGGEIWVEAEAGLGSTFYFSIKK